MVKSLKKGQWSPSQHAVSALSCLLFYSLSVRLHPFTFTFSAVETPSCVQISSANETERGRAVPEHALRMNQAKHPVLLLYNTGMLALTSSAFCGGTVVRTRLLMCENM